MECIVCGTDSAGHRTVVSVDSGAPVGGFCHACEAAVFGDCFDRFRAAAGGRCVACERDAAYAFLDWLERPGDETGETRAPSDAPDADRDVPADAPALCRTHFQALTSESSDWGRGRDGPAADSPR